MVRDADRMEEVVGNTLLKSIEEPPPRTVILLLTDRPDGLLATIRSRCQRVDFAYAPPVRSEAIDAVRDRVRGRSCHASTGGPPPRSSSSRSSRPRSTRAGAASEAAAATELEELDADIEARGYPPRTAAALRRRLSETQRQELRRAKTDALIEGISAIEQAYLDVLADAPGRGGGRSGPGVRRARRLPRRPAGRRVQPQRRLAAAAPGVAAPARRLSPQEVRVGGGAFGTLPDPAGIAQSAEQLTRNEQVKGSNPFPGSTASLQPRRLSGRRRRDRDRHRVYAPPDGDLQASLAARRLRRSGGLRRRDARGAPHVVAADRPGRPGAERR